jgi:hypothetical protein
MRYCEFLRLLSDLIFFSPSSLHSILLSTHYSLCDHIGSVISGTALLWCVVYQMGHTITMWTELSILTWSEAEESRDGPEVLYQLWRCGVLNRIPGLAILSFLLLWHLGALMLALPHIWLLCLSPKIAVRFNGTTHIKYLHDVWHGVGVQKKVPSALHYHHSSC